MMVTEVLAPMIGISDCISFTMFTIMFSIKLFGCLVAKAIKLFLLWHPGLKKKLIVY